MTQPNNKLLINAMIHKIDRINESVQSLIDKKDLEITRLHLEIANLKARLLIKDSGIESERFNN